MSSSRFVVLCVFSLLSAILPVPGQVDTLLQQLSDPRTTDAARSQLIASSRSDAGTEAEIVAAIPRMLAQQPPDPVMRSEAELAGALRIKAAIPVLTQLLGRRSWNPGGSIYSQQHLLGDSVARALYEMGPAAYPALARALKSDNRDMRARAMDVLLLGNTTESIQILRAHTNAEPDPQLQRFLRLRTAKAKPSDIDRRVAHP